MGGPIRESVANFTTDANSSETLATTANVQVGDLLVVFTGTDDSDAPASPTFPNAPSGSSYPTGWTNVFSIQWNANAAEGTRLRCDWIVATSSGVTSIQINSVSGHSFLYGSCIVIDGSLGAAVDNGSATGSTTTASAIAPTATPSSPPELLLCAFQQYWTPAAATFTAPPSMATVTDTNSSMFGRLSVCSEFWQGVGATGTRTAGVTSTTEWLAASVLIKNVVPPPHLTAHIQPYTDRRRTSNF